MSFNFVLLTLLLFFTLLPLTLFSLELVLLSADLLVVLICDVLLSSEVFDSGDELLWQPLLLTGCFFLGRPFNLGAERVLILIEDRKKRKRKIHYEIWEENVFFYYVEPHWVSTLFNSMYNQIIDNISVKHFFIIIVEVYHIFEYSSSYTSYVNLYNMFQIWAQNFDSALPRIEWAQTRKLSVYFPAISMFI